ncbi:MAG: fumarylacetoacetate hydrolase family protein [Acidobacteriota bacterium]|nr:fumarylacetoacetate hydrolase family protein [Acidobacteriota bacterium]
MKLATLKSSSRDGELIVVSRDLKTSVRAAHIAPNLRTAVEEWDAAAPGLQELYDALNAGNAEGSFAFDEEAVASPLPRSFSWLDGSAYIQHVILVRKARNAPLPEGLMTDPLMYQGGSDTFLAPREDIPLIDQSHGVDFEGEIAVVLGDTPMGVSAEDAHQHIRLLMLVNDVSLRGLIPPELKKGFGFLVSKPSSAFSPVAVTPDELGDDWRDGRVFRNLDVTYNGEFYGNADAGAMHFSFGELIAHIAQTRALSAGTILGSGTVSNEDTARGSSCLAEKRMLEKIETGEFITPFMKPGDTIRIEMKDENGASIFGTIDQKVKKVDL